MQAYAISQADPSMQTRFAELQMLFKRLHQRCLDDRPSKLGAHPEALHVSGFDPQTNSFELIRYDTRLVVRMHYAPTGDAPARAVVRLYGVGEGAKGSGALMLLDSIEVSHDGRAVCMGGGADAICVNDDELLVEVLAQILCDCMYVNAAQ